MKKVAVFGNAGGGKSTLARVLAELTELPLYLLDMIQYRADGKIPDEEFSKAHADLMARDRWIIEGYGSRESAWARFSAADTLVYIDLPFLTHFLWITKRFCKGMFANPSGWPEGSPIISSHIQSYRVLWLCHKYLTPHYRTLVATVSHPKRAYHLRSAREMAAFLTAVKAERANP